MSENKLGFGKFDETLERALKSHLEPVPADFTERMLSRIKEVEQRRILARLILQQRLALAGCITLLIAAIVSAVVFPDAVTAVFKSIPASLVEQEQILIYGVSQAIKAVRSNWQFYTIFAGVFGFIVYALADLLMANGE